jgi:signal transduction histidine kinase
MKRARGGEEGVKPMRSVNALRDRMFRNLYAKLAAVLLALFLLIGGLYILLTIYTTRLYFQEVNQKLNRVLAQHLVSEKVLMKEGRVDEEALRNIFHMLMVVNPVIEVYLLDARGDILAYSAPPGKVKRSSVSLEPVKRLLHGASPLPVLGDDPRDPGLKKVFSAAPISLDGRTEGYLYIILGGEEFESEAQMLQGSYILRLSIWAAAGGLLFALVAALLLFNRMTRRLRHLTVAMETFRQGDFSEPSAPLLAAAPQGDEIDRIGAIFSEMAERIVRQFTELKASDALRREMVANIAHDLRTPLSSLRGYLETILIKERNLTEDEKRDYIMTAIKRSDQLGKLVSGLFEMAKLDSPEVQVRLEPFSLLELVQDILQKFRLAAEKNDIELRMNVAEDLPPVLADIGLSERVFENLIDNAIRYTPRHGSISVSAQYENGRIKVMVSDTGSGIKAEDIPHLFDRLYYRERRGGEEGGSGLGLIIAKRILELHGSGIEVTSAVDAGTAFMFFLPIQKNRS